MRPIFLRSIAAAATSSVFALAHAADPAKSMSNEPTANANTTPSGSAQNPANPSGASAQAADGSDAKRLFAANCSWCHQDFGMRQGDGPKLAGTSKTEEQVIERIKHGKTPMPSFEGKLSEKDIKALAQYIKALPAK